MCCCRPVGSFFFDLGSSRARGYVTPVPELDGTFKNSAGVWESLVWGFFVLANSSKISINYGFNPSVGAVIISPHAVISLIILFFFNPTKIFRLYSHLFSPLWILMGNVWFSHGHEGISRSKKELCFAACQLYLASRVSWRCWPWRPASVCLPLFIEDVGGHRLSSTEKTGTSFWFCGERVAVLRLAWLRPLNDSESLQFDW